MKKPDDLPSTAPAAAPSGPQQRQRSSRLNYVWRVFATGFAFVVFGIAGILAGVIGVPLLRLVVHDRQRQQRVARRAVQGFFALFIQMLVSLRIMTWSVNDPAALAAPGTLVVATTMSVGTLILFESTLSFLGLGIQPPAASWGNMLTGAQELLQEAPVLALWPGLLIFLTVIAFNFLGDGLQDALDPRSERR